MADYCLQIMLTPAMHDLGDAFSNAKRYKRGDIVDVIAVDRVGTLAGNRYVFNGVVGSPNLAFVFVRGLPTAITAKQLRDALTSAPSDSYLDHKNRLVRRQLRNRRFRLRLSLLQSQRMQELLNDKYTTITWIQARQLVIKKVVSNRFDAATDDETGRIVDGDLTLVE